VRSSLSFMPTDIPRLAEVGIDQLNKIIALLRKKTLLRLISEGNVPEPSKKKSGSRTRPTR